MRLYLIKNHNLPNSIYIELPPNSFSVWVQDNALPIALQSFTARAEEQSSILHWQSAQEVNFEGFDIERSLDGKVFSSIAWVPAEGGESPQFYNYRDLEVDNGNSYYYRLKMIDTDGSYEYSDIKVVSFESSPLELEVFPNPITDEIKMNWDSHSANQVELNIIDALGRNVFSQKFKVEQGRNQLIIDSSDWGTGTFFALLRSTSGFQWKAMLVKQ